MAAPQGSTAGSTKGAWISADDLAEFDRLVEQVFLAASHGDKRILHQAAQELRFIQLRLHGHKE